MTHSKHTPTPFYGQKLTAIRVDDGTFNIGYSDEKHADYDGVPQITVARGLEEAEAAFIVRAVNSHEALVEALKRAADSLAQISTSAAPSSEMANFAEQETRLAMRSLSAAEAEDR